MDIDKLNKLSRVFNKLSQLPPLEAPPEAPQDRSLLGSLEENDLVHGHDGPVDAFIAMSRAMELVYKGAAPDAVANLLYETMEKYGWLKAGEQVESDEFEMEG